MTDSLTVCTEDATYYITAEGITVEAEAGLSVVTPAALWNAFGAFAEILQDLAAASEEGRGDRPPWAEGA